MLYSYSSEIRGREEGEDSPDIYARNLSMAVVD